jgi:hypothetical protein
MKRARKIQQWLFFISAPVLSVLVYFEVMLPQGILVVILALLVAVVGLPHGALDPLVARKAGLWRNSSGLA